MREWGKQKKQPPLFNPTMIMLFLIPLLLVPGIVWSPLGTSAEKMDVSLERIKQKQLNIMNSLDRFYGVAVAGKKIWLCGHYGTILYSADLGQNWEKQESGVTSPLFGITAVNEKMLCAVGGEGVIIHTRDGGKTWKKMESGPKEELFQVTFLNESKGWVVGAYCTLLHTEDGGQTWQSASLDVSIQKDPNEIAIVPMLNSIFFVDDLSGWIAGEKGTVLHTTDGGKNWVMKNQGVGETYLSDVCFRTADEGMIVGEQGDCFLTRDRGEKWEKVPTQTTSALFAVTLKDGRYLLVGAHGTSLTLDTTEQKMSITPLLPAEMRTMDWLLANWFSSIKVSSEGDVVMCGWGLIVVKTAASENIWDIFLPFN